MEIRTLRHFIVVGDTGNISAAARKLNLTQPCLSRQIKALEDELGVPLLKRNAQSVQLTVAGEFLHAEARKLIQFTDQLVEKMHASSSLMPLRIGYAPSITGNLLGNVIPRYTKKHPNVRISLFDGTSEELKADLLNSKLDIAISATGEDARYSDNWLPLWSMNWKLLVSNHHSSLAKTKNITPMQLEGLPMLLLDRKEYPEYWERVSGYFKRMGINAKLGGEFNSMNSLQAAVAANLGIALIAEETNVVSIYAESISTRNITEMPEPVQVSLGSQPSHKRATYVQDFIDEVMKETQLEELATKQ